MSNNQNNPTQPAPPDCMTDAMLVYLDDLRISGATNMFGAGAYLEAVFGLDEKPARDVLVYWMRTFSDRHPNEE